MSGAITSITAVVTACVGWIGQYMGAIMAEGNELLLVYFAMIAPIYWEIHPTQAVKTAVIDAIAADIKSPPNYFNVT